MKPGLLVVAALVGGSLIGSASVDGPAAATQTSSAGAQTPGAPAPPRQRTPARDVRPGEPPQKGTATLRGHVVAGDTGDPVRRAMVQVRAQRGQGGGAATTDAEGRWEIGSLPAGRYTVSASKNGYIGAQHGQRRPEQGGTPIEVRDGETIERILITLPRGGVITGYVADEFGDPVAGAEVNALRFRYMEGGRQLSPSGGGQTDDRGVFRIYGLTPGEYYVSAAVRTQPMMSMQARLSVNLDGYAATFFPGTPNVSEARRVAVREARETTDVSFSLTPTRLVRLSGRAVTMTGEPVAQAFVAVTPADRMGASMMGMGGAMTRADGTFEVTGIAPGTYNLMLRPRNRPDPKGEFAMLRLSVGVDDIENLLLVASRGGIARGTIGTDDGTPLPARPADVNVFARPAEPSLNMPMGGESKVHDDGTFEITGLFEPRLVWAGLNNGQEWSVKGVFLDGRDVTDVPIDFSGGKTVEGLHIVFTSKSTDLSGTVTGDRGGAETDATVIIFPEDRARWTFASRFVRTARPNQDGRYSVRGMPPHDYLLVAVREVEPGQWQDPDYLESLRDQAVRVSLAEAETRVQDVRLAAPR